MLYTDRLNLEIIDMSRKKEIFELWSDEDVIKYTNVKTPRNLDECEENIKNRIIERLDKDNPNHFMVLFNNKLIGLAGFPILDKKENKISIYYQFKKEYWRQGFGYETSKVLLDYILSTYINPKIVAGAVVGNIGSIRILEKLGFEEVAIEKCAHDGKDLIHFKYTN